MKRNRLVTTISFILCFLICFSMVASAVNPSTSVTTQETTQETTKQTEETEKTQDTAETTETSVANSTDNAKAITSTVTDDKISEDKDQKTETDKTAAVAPQESKVMQNAEATPAPAAENTEEEKQEDPDPDKDWIFVNDLPENIREAQWFKNGLKKGLYTQAYSDNLLWNNAKQLIGKSYMGESVADIIAMSKSVEGFSWSEFFRGTVYAGYTEKSISGHKTMDELYEQAVASKKSSVRTKRNAPTTRAGGGLESLNVGDTSTVQLYIRNSVHFDNNGGTKNGVYYHAASNLISKLRNEHGLTKKYTTMFGFDLWNVSNSNFHQFTGTHNVDIMALKYCDLSNFLRCTTPGDAEPIGFTATATLKVIAKGSNYVDVSITANFPGSQQDVGGRIRKNFNPTRQYQIILTKWPRKGNVAIDTKLNRVRYKVYDSQTGGNELTEFYHSGLPFLETANTTRYVESGEPGLAFSALIKTSDTNKWELYQNKGVWIEEIQTLPGYIKYDGRVNVKLENGDITWVVPKLDANNNLISHPYNNITTNKMDIPDLDPVSILLKKQNADGTAVPMGNGKLEGAEFSIKYYEILANTEAELAGLTPKYTWTITTNKNGYAKIPDAQLPFITNPLGGKEHGLPKGTISIQETKAPEGYLVNDTVHIRQIRPDLGQNLSVANAPIVKEQVIKRPVELTKKKTDVGNATALEEGAEFQIYLKSAGSYDKAKAGEKDILVTGADGKAKSKDLPYGTYVLHQTKGATNYAFSEDIEVVIDTNSTEPLEVTAENIGTRAKLKINKIDSETKEAVTVPGSTFKIRNLNPAGHVVDSMLNGEWITFNGVEEFTADTTGYVILPGELKWGLYELVEVRADFKHILNKEPIKFEVTVATPTNPAEYIVPAIVDGTIEINFENRPKIHPKITKTDITGENPIPGAVVQIFKGKEKVFEDVTDENGELASVLLEPGDYTFKEVFTPSGYALNTNTFNFSISDDGVVTGDTSFKNDFTEILIQKTDKKTNQKLGGAVFGMYSDGKLIETKATDETGLVKWDKLPYGKYEVKELEAPEGYKVSKSVLTFHINDTWVNPGVVEFGNSKLTFGTITGHYGPGTPREYVQTSDDNSIFIFTALTLFGLAGIFFFSRKKKEEEEL